MNPSDTNAVDPREDGTNKATIMDQDTTKPAVNDPKAPKVGPGPDTRDEPYSPK